jgi:hypothetical protein
MPVFYRTQAFSVCILQSLCWLLHRLPGKIDSFNLMCKLHLDIIAVLSHSKKKLFVGCPSRLTTGGPRTLGQGGLAIVD